MPNFRLSLDTDKLNRLFPFYFVLNSHLEIERCGQSLQKWLQLKPGDHFHLIFRIIEPVAVSIDFTQLSLCCDKLIVLDTVDGRNRWTGQMECWEAEQKLLFLGNPSLNSIDELAAKKLTDKDFAIGDPILEMLRFQQSQVKTEEALRIAKDEVEEASRAKQIFLANMSHEIRTPMNGILGIGSLLYKTKLTPKQKEFTKLIIESGNNLLHIVNDILDLTKIQSGQFMLESTPFDLADKILSTLQAFHFKAEDKGIELAFVNNLKKDLIVEGDPYRLGQVLSNLLSNALKFTYEGKITIQADQVADKGRTAFFEVRVVDTGIGISKDNLATIFQQFVQATVDITRKYGGTGLGLSIAKNLVEMQGGEIIVVSEVNKGSVFTVRIPYKLSSESLLKKELRKSGGIKSMERKKILVAEDVPVNQLIAKHILKSWGQVVSVAENGTEVLKMLERNNYDLILMDIHMPEMNGVVTTRLIRKLPNPKKAGIPIIAVTAAAFKDEIERYLESGMNEFITKPYTEEKLFEVIRRVLKMGTAEKKVETPEEEVPAVKEKFYDLTTLLQYGDDDPNFIKDIITLFITNGRQDLNSLQAAIAAREIPEVFQVAHRMKSSLHTMGISSIETAIKRIDACSRNNENTEEIPALYTKVESTMLIVFDQLMEDFGIVC